MTDTSHKIMVIGLDGASFNFIGPFCQTGIMPNLYRFWQKSCSGELVSSYPPVTPAAWVTFMTGKLAGKHHVLDFEQFRFTDNSLRYNSSVDIEAQSLWAIISAHNGKVGVINVPMTYPPEPVNGILIAGHNVPNPSTQYTYPTAFKADLLKCVPDYLNHAPKPHHVRSASAFENMVKEYTRTVDDYHQAVNLVDEKLDWDFLMVVFPHTDIGHRMWPYMNPESSHLYPERRDRVARIFSKLDQALGSLFHLAEDRNADVIIMSDHGHGTTQGWVRANKLLQKWGYITMDNPLRWLGKRLYRECQKVRYKDKYTRPARYIDEKLGIEWSKTKAVVCQAVMWGHLYLNVRGRQPHGIVEPGEEYDALRKDLIERFLAATDPDTEEKLFDKVIKPETVYGPSKTPWAHPDLLLVPPEGMRVNKRIRHSWVVKRTVPERAEGTHLLKGLWMAAGPQIKSNTQFEANIQDVAPTILALMGLPVPDDMDGKVLTSIFKQKPKPLFSKTSRTESETRDTAVYSIEEEKQIEQQLADLGYID
ncbi:MAG: alkaline phosphatase family protein [Planctomycetota bacterium]|nr:MAG: alkaline phosphatase family protein [Planctomycetota bacterium]